MISITRLRIQIPVLRFIIFSLLFVSIQSLKSQSPGGVSTGLEIWLKADAGFTYNSTTDAEWLDQSPRALVLNANLVQGPDADSAPTFNPNGTNYNPGIIFDGVDTGLATAVDAANFNFSEWTVISVQQTTPGNSHCVWHYGVNGENTHAMFIDPSPAGFNFNVNNAVDVTITNPEIDDTLPHIVGYSADGSSTEVYVDASEVATSGGQSALPGDGAFLVGLDADGAEAQDGDNHFFGGIGEILMFRRKLTSIDRQKVESYLALKYGVTIATDYVASDGITNIWVDDSDGYDNAIFGIGRDDASGLNQKVSKSIDNGTILTMALDADFTSSNADVTRTTMHTNDLQFLTFAHNGANTENQSVAIGGTIFNTQLNRIWKVDRTANFTQSVNLKFEGFGEEWSLVTDSDDDFSSGATIVNALDQNGEITGVSLSAGHYFSLIKIQESPGGVGSSFQLWLKADTGVTDASGVSNWVDQSPNALTGTQSNANNRPAFIANDINFYPSIDFQGEPFGNLDPNFDYIDFGLESLNLADKIAVYYVGNTDRSSPDHYVIGQKDGFERWRYANGYMQAVKGGAFYGDILDNFTQEVDKNYVSGYILDNTTGFHTIDGSPLPSETFPAGNWPTDQETWVGATEIGGQYSYDGQISEIIVYNNVLNATEQKLVESYLALKYGITLDQTSATAYMASNNATKMWDETVSTIYNNDIFGIGRDDISGLNQKISKSTNTGTILTIALDADFSVANDGAGRTTAHTNNMQFFTIANNGDATSIQATELDASLDFDIRLAREWKVDATNFAENVSMKFEGYDETWSLIATADGDFSSGVTIIGPLNTDGEFTTTTPPSDGLTFTLAKAQEAPGNVAGNLQLWVKADFGTYSDAGTTIAVEGNTVQQWNDVSANGYNFTQTTDPLRKPIFEANSLNFNPQLQFNGSNTLVTNTFSNLPNGASGRLMRVVATPTVFNGDDIAFAHGTATDGQAHFIAGRQTDNTFLYGSWGATNDKTQTNYWEVGVPVISGGGYNNAFGTTSIYKDGVEQTADVSGNPVWNTVNTIARIGADVSSPNPNRFWTGNIAEVIVYDADISTADQSKIDSYLGLKYGISLDIDYVASDNTPVWTNNSDGYDNAIFGIGRDDDSGLNQKISKSANTGTILAVALDNDFTSANLDASRTTAHTNDKQFLMVANNGAATTNQTTEINTNTHAERIAREWKVDKTANFTQDINLKFTGFDDNWELIKDDDGDFSNGTTSLGTLDANGEISGVTLADGDYFTLHTNAAAPTILSFTPKLAGNGETVTLTGNGFTGATAVTFGGVAATSFAVVSGTEITAVVGTGASGDIQVTNPQGNDTESGFIYKVAQYDFENNALDETDNNHDGTEINTVTYETGAQGQAICFDNGPGYVKLPDNLIRSLPEFTISLRFKTTGTGAILGYQNSAPLSSAANFIPILMLTDDGRLKGTLWTSTGTSIQAISTNPVNDGNWHQVDFTGSTNTVTIYLDGSVEASTTGASVDHLDMSINQLGLARTTNYNNTPTGWEYFDGCIDDMLLIDKALTPQELEDITALPEPTITSFTPTEAGEQDTVTITGTNFEGATQVTFGGTDADSYTVDSASQITAVIDTGATGDVAVTTAGGTATANGFTFLPDSFTLSETALTLDEDGGTGTFTVVLDTEPSSNVVFDISSDDSNEATVDLAQLTFTTTNWNTPQTITITGVDDDIARDDSATITVSVNDAGSDDPFDTLADQSVAITLTDDDIVGFSVSESALTIDEDGGTDTFTIVLDSEPTSNVVFDISSDDIDEATVDSAQLTFTSSNWDTPQTITVTGVDDTTTADDTATITVSVNAAGSDDTYDSLPDETVAITLTNDDANFTIDAIADANVNENATYTSVTPNLSGDTPIGNLTYTLGGTDAADFTIDSNTGVISMIARDFESPNDDDADNVYEVSITATDDDGNTDSEDWTVTVDNVTETASFTIDAISDETIDEETPYTGPIPSIIGAPVGNVTYTVGGADAAIFSINNATGQVVMPLRSFENPDDVNDDNVYEVNITATDEDGNTTSEAWTVTLRDVVEIANFTINTITDANIDENSAYVSTTPMLSGDAPIGNIAYALGGADAADFTIDSNTGVISMIARDFESPDDDDADNVYEVSITATDDDGNTDSEDWTVTVDNVTETASFTIDAISDETINEETPYTGPIPSITGAPVGNVMYTVGGADAAIFSINNATGQVVMPLRSFENPDDVNDDNVYEVNITATDEDGNTASEAWTVTLRDVVEIANFTINTITDANIDENSAYVSATPMLSGDAPIGNVAYALGGADATDFTVNTTTGVVSMLAQDFENPVDSNSDNSYEVTITATDEDGNTASTSWSVLVSDVDEAEPDADGDGVPDSEDAFPNDPNEDTDTDGDGTGDNADTDDDGDGTPDNEDAFPLDENEDTDTDGDGIGNNTDEDDDGDGLPDTEDPDSTNPDTDGDGILDGEDADVDGDGVVDNGTDSDGDGINDDNDPVDDAVDSDGDGVPDVDDAFPNDSNESVDSDGDGVGANADSDDSNPNIGEEAQVISAEAFTPNGDGINDTWVIQGIENYPNAIVTVYNRYGHEVFKAINYQNDWSGKNGSGSGTLPAGSYYYIIELRNESAPIDGWIFINY